MVKPTIQFRTLSEVQFASYAENILVKMTENASIFSQPTPSLADLEEALLSYRRAATDAAFRDTRMLLLKNQALYTLHLTVYEMSLYVSCIARGNRALILAAGFLPMRDNIRIAEPAKPMNLRDFNLLISKK